MAGGRVKVLAVRLSEREFRVLHRAAVRVARMSGGPMTASGVLRYGGIALAHSLLNHQRKGTR